MVDADLMNFLTAGDYLNLFFQQVTGVLQLFSGLIAFLAVNIFLFVSLGILVIAVYYIWKMLSICWRVYNNWLYRDKIDLSPIRDFVEPIEQRFRPSAKKRKTKMTYDYSYHQAQQNDSYFYYGN